MVHYTIVLGITGKGKSSFLPQRQSSSTRVLTTIICSQKFFIGNLLINFSRSFAVL